MSHLKLIKTSESLLQSGQLPEAIQNFKKISLSKVSTTEVVSVAQLARRTGQISAGIKLMQRQLTRRQSLDSQSIEFKAEYANLLTLSGCIKEALDILDSVTIVSPPEALLAKAWCLFEVWDFSQAIPLLKKYVRIQSDEYLRLAGYVNLAEAYLGAGDLKSAISISSKAINETTKKSYTRLCANALHIRAQVYEQQHELSQSDKDLAQALKYFGGAHTSDAFLIHRQIAINESLRTKKTSALQILKEQAKLKGEYESLRLCDFKNLELKFNNETFNQLYIGSPYGQFRLRLCRQFPEGKLKKTYIWGDKNGAVLDLSTPKITFRGKIIETTPQILRLLLTLLQDFYNPARVGSIFSSSFPGTHYVANHSPTVVHQALKRLRAWLEENQIPLSVECTKRRYSLVQENPVAVIVSVDVFKVLDGLTTLQKIESAFGKTEFSLMEASKVLNLSKASTHRALVSETVSGNIEKKYQGRSTKYSLVVPQ